MLEYLNIMYTCMHLAVILYQSLNNISIFKVTVFYYVLL